MKEQIELFKIIKSKVSDQYNFVYVLEELLDLSTDAIYRRIRGEKELIFSELKKICAKFDLSMDEILHLSAGNSALFSYVPIDITKIENYTLYMENLLNRMTMLKSAPEKEIFFTAQDIPFFHFLKYPELTFFKLYAWNATINREPISYCKFCSLLDKEKLTPIYKQIHQTYMAIPSKEIWTNQTIDTILRLLEYHFETHSFEIKDNLLLLLNQLTELMNDVKLFADDNCKGYGEKTPFSLYIYKFCRFGKQLHAVKKRRLCIMFDKTLYYQQHGNRKRRVLQ